VFDPEEWMTVLATFVRGHEWAGIHFGPFHRMRVAEIASNVPWHVSARAGA
jgi:hypothetical protein